MILPFSFTFDKELFLVKKFFHLIRQWQRNFEWHCEEYLSRRVKCLSSCWGGTEFTWEPTYRAKGGPGSDAVSSPGSCASEASWTLGWLTAAALLSIDCWKKSTSPSSTFVKVRFPLWTLKSGKTPFSTFKTVHLTLLALLQAVLKVVLSFSFLFISAESLKDHSKSQKNHKIKNSILLDSTWIDLYSEHIIWYVLVQSFSVVLDLCFSVINWNDS
jgi:hypothetical protein